jgi:hypothetical protein
MSYSFSRRTLLHGDVRTKRYWSLAYEMLHRTSELASPCEQGKKSRDSSVGIALGYGLNDQCSRDRLPAEAGNFSLHHRVQNSSGDHSASCPMGTRGSFPRGKRPGREAEHSPPSSAEVKNAWSYTSTPQYVFMAWCLLKHRDNFTFTLWTR